MSHAASLSTGAYQNRFLRLKRHELSVDSTNIETLNIASIGVKAGQQGNKLAGRKKIAYKWGGPKDLFGMTQTH